MKTIFKNLWKIHSNLKSGEYVAITTNGATRKSDGSAIMGRGCAFEAAQLFPDLQKRLGACLRQYGNHVFVCPEYRLVTFPVKVSWEQPADLALIEKSCQELVLTIQRYALNCVYLALPGCGNGRRSPEEVLPILDRTLKDAPVVIVRRPNEA